MRLLAIDIGGTNSRFADCTIKSKTNFDIQHIFSFDTVRPDINSFQNLINVYDLNKPDTFINFIEYDLICIAVAGPVSGRQCSPPNIRWNIDLDDTPSLPKTFLLNDFVAQAYAFIQPEEIQKLIPIRTSEKSEKGSSAVIGAGTGLGHCLITLIDKAQNNYQVIASEAGHSGFTFNQNEKEIEAFFYAKTGQHFIYNDLVVSGSGLVLLHEYYSGKKHSAQNILADMDNNKVTLNCFSRFYARACRNYCLSNCVTDKLIISGGLAAKHPEIILNPGFIYEFENLATHKMLLRNISIYLNNNEKSGLIGAMYFALSNQYSVT